MGINDNKNKSVIHIPHDALFKSAMKDLRVERIVRSPAGFAWMTSDLRPVCRVLRPYTSITSGAGRASG